MPLSAILQIEPSPLSRELHHAVAVADSLHQTTAVPPIPVVMTRSRKVDGLYTCIFRPSRPKQIEISSVATYPGLTLLHEIGHMLDHLTLNPLKRDFASEHDPGFKPLWELWRRSRLVQRLHRLLARKRPRVGVPVRNLVQYQLRPDELWARTYTQWITTRSNDLLLGSQLHSRRNSPPIIGTEISHFHWEDDDFLPIMTAVDELFQAAGLR